MRRAWLIVFAGVAINLCFGVLYSWSVFAENLRVLYGWPVSLIALPYTTAVFMFAALMIPGGKIQDRMGPRFAIVLGGILVGSGMILSSFMTTVPGLVVAFGVLGGSGIGIGYASTAPCAVKWFPPEKKGLISGLVVAGFGLAPLYIAPLTTFLVSSIGIANTFRVFGVGFTVIVVLLGTTFKNPETSPKNADGTSGSSGGGHDFTWREMVATKQFKQLWVMHFAGAMAGLMIIGHLATIVNQQSNGMVMGAGIVAIAAIANAVGRPAAGFISDKLGRTKTMTVIYLAQALVLVFYSSFSTYVPLLIGACIMTFGYGAMPPIYISVTADFYGLKNLGHNYGIVFSAWGIGGVTGPQIAGFITDATGTYQTAFWMAAVLCVVGAMIGFVIKPVDQSA